jgi:ABC-type glycerol-3-phosphate transport system permease component
MTGDSAGARQMQSRITARWRRRLTDMVLYLVLIAAGVTFALPLVWVLSTSLKRSAEIFIVPVRWIPANPQWSNFVKIFELLPMASFIRNSALVTVLGTIGSVASSLFVSFSLARLRWPGRELIFAVLLATMMLPGIVTLIPTFVLIKYLGWLNTFYPLFVPSWFGNAFYIFLMRQFMAGLPIELDEAARIDGASSFWILWRVIAPMCGPAVAAVAIFSFLAHYNDFMGPLLYLSSNEKFTLPLGIAWYEGRYGNFWNLVMAASTVSIAPVIVLFFVAQRYFIQGIQLSGLAGR